MKFTEQTPMELFENGLREEGIRISDIPVDRIRQALDEPFDYFNDYVTVKIPSRHEVMIRRAVAQELVRN